MALASRITFAPGPEIDEHRTVRLQLLTADRRPTNEHATIRGFISGSPVAGEDREVDSGAMQVFGEGAGANHTSYDVLMFEVTTDATGAADLLVQYNLGDEASLYIHAELPNGKLITSPPITFAGPA